MLCVTVFKRKSPRIFSACDATGYNNVSHENTNDHHAGKASSVEGGFFRGTANRDAGICEGILLCMRPGQRTSFGRVTRLDLVRLLHHMHPAQQRSFPESHSLGCISRQPAFKKQRNKARELASGAARENARDMADAPGLSIGAQLQIIEDYFGSPWSFWSGCAGWGRGSSQGMSQAVVRMDQGASGGISKTIAHGKISIRTNRRAAFA